jgi:hypothetical protein
MEKTVSEIGILNSDLISDQFFLQCMVSMTPMVNLPLVSMVLLIPVANLQPVTMSLAVNFVVDTGGKYRVQTIN